MPTQTIKHWYTSKTIYECEAPNIAEAIKAAVKSGANLSGANLRGANLRDADLRGANLSGAYLSGADLSGANLRGANLSGADLRDANLSGADLRDANLRGANLSGANLSGADLRDANLRGADLSGANLSGAYLSGAKVSDSTVLDTGETFKTYLDEVLPALLTAGGKKVATIAKAWDCHQWSNCPMHAAFDINGSDEGPALLRPRIRQFVQLFDAKLLPCPVQKKVGAKSAKA